MAVASNGTLVCLEEPCKGTHGAGKQGVKPGPTQARSAARHIKKNHFDVSQRHVQDFIDTYKEACLHYSCFAAEYEDHGPMRGPSTPVLKDVMGGGLVEMFRCPHRQDNDELCGKLISKDVGNRLEHKSLYRHLGTGHGASLQQKQEVRIYC